MTDCSSLYVLSTLACRLAECLSEDELGMLAADLTTLGDMLASVLAHRAAGSIILFPISSYCRVVT